MTVIKVEKKYQNIAKKKKKKSTLAETSVYRIYKQCFVYHTLLGLFRSKFCNNTNHISTGQNEYYHFLIKDMIRHLKTFGPGYVNFFEVFFIFFMNYKNIQYIMKHLFKFYHLDLNIVESISQYFIQIKNLNDIDQCFKNDVMVAGCLRLISLPDPITKQMQQNLLFDKNAAVKFKGWSERESRLAYKILICDKRLEEMYKYGSLRVLTESVLDIFMETFGRSFSRKTVKKNLISTLFYADEEEILQYNNNKNIQYICSLSLFCCLCCFAISFFFVFVCIFSRNQFRSQDVEIDACNLKNSVIGLDGKAIKKLDRYDQKRTQPIPPEQVCFDVDSSRDIQQVQQFNQFQTGAKASINHNKGGKKQGSINRNKGGNKFQKQHRKKKNNNTKQYKKKQSKNYQTEEETEEEPIANRTRKKQTKRKEYGLVGKRSSHFGIISTNPQRIPEPPPLLSPPSTKK